jgi:GTPase
MHVMNELGVPMTKILYVMNKVDLTRIEDAFDKSTYLDMLDSKKHVLPVSAKTGFNIDQLKNIMTSLLFPEKSRRPDDEHKEEEECNEGISS